MVERWLVAGLGNPGSEYAKHRHNVGQMSLDVLAERIGAGFVRHKTNNRVAEGLLGDTKLVLAKPNTFMNLSGAPVAALARFFGVGANRLVLLHDELDIPFGAVRLKNGGGHGGHNGVRDVRAALTGADFFRVRIGVGRPPGRQDAANFVLSQFAQAERKQLPSLLSDAAAATEDLIMLGLLAAQQRWHAPG